MNKEGHGTEGNYATIEPLPLLHPKFRILDAEKIILRAKAFNESGLTGESKAIAEALEMLRRSLMNQKVGLS